ncbi:Hydrophobin 2 [Mycena venus]|uniref:Hydrophobin n=1 Tax=Mycena venus TaxID=2733690 RepID=A0A8H6Y923_9AGAR|nr:Hydrophobin 2 [Mycena venus]
MFSKLSAAFAAVFVILVAATPTTPLVTPPTSPQCCVAVVPSTNEAAIAVAALVGIDLTSINPSIPIGLTCTPITVIGDNCGNTKVTCDSPPGEWGGLLALNCLPITT